MGFLDKIKSLLSTEKSDSKNLKSEYSESTELNHGTVSKTQSDIDSMVDKTKEFISGTVDEVKEQGSQLWDEVKEKASELNEATREYREKLVDKAKEALDNIDDFVDQTVQKAKKLEEEENLKDTNKDQIADKPIDFGKSLTESREDFFNKAEQWLEKNESNDKSQENESNNHKVIQPLELPKEPEESINN